MLPYNLEMDASDYLEIVLEGIREELSKLEKKNDESHRTWCSSKML